MRTAAGSVLLYILLTGTIAFAQARDVGADIDGVMLPLAARHDVSGVVLIAKGSRTIAFRSYGLANREWQVPVSRDTRFLIGSISKQFTAAGILRLQDQGKLSLEDSLSKWFPGFPSAEQISVRLLLQHRAGLGRDLPKIERTRTQELTTAEIIDLLEAEPIVFQPGAKTQYSNNGYRVLARIIELVSGRDYPDFIEDDVLRPAGMTSSGVIRPQVGVERLARGYTPFPGPNGLGPAPFAAIRQTWGPGAVFSTADDLAKWSNALGSDLVLAEASRREMLTATKDGRGLGLGLATRYDRPTAGHDGVYFGFNASFDRFLDDGLTIVYLGNIETGALDQVRRALLAIATGHMPVPASPRRAVDPNVAVEPKDYLGTYEVFPGFNLMVRNTGRALLLGAGEGDFLLEPLSRDLFDYRLKYATVAFQRDAAGRVTGLNWQQGDQSFVCRRIRDSAPFPN